MKRHVTVTIMSFGYEHSEPPKDAEFVLDVRQLPNPKRAAGLEHLNGLDPKVQHYVLHEDKQDIAYQIIEQTAGLLEVTIPHFRHGDHSNDIHYLAAVGCKRGNRRSVAITEFIATRLRGRLSSQHFTVRTEHRDIGKSE